jgi:hypothetical protein
MVGMNDQNRPILLVEDNEMDADLTRRAFARRNLLNPLVVVRDGEQAIQCIRDWENGAPLPVVILMDINLPKIGGLEVVKRYKSLPLLQKIPVFVLATSHEDREIQSAYQLGADGYLVKPVNFEKFVEVTAKVNLYWNILAEPPAPL